jgi:20S proteasome alpha/beta subunit
VFLTPEPQRHRKDTRLTVCIAATCENGTVVVGAADRMLTSGDIEFEPVQTKIINLTSSIVALISGDASFQVEVLYKVRDEVEARVKAQPTTWLRVEEVAQIYIKHWSSIRRNRAETQVLTPLGLDSGSFISGQQLMSPQLVDKLAAELLNYEVPDATTIFAGVDDIGAHVYTTRGGRMSCDDAAGFSAIGAGAWHADSQLMFGGHTKFTTFADTLLLTYSAKKRSEVAPGVGSATDMFYIGPQLGSYVFVGQHVLTRLETIYQEEQKRQARARQKSKEKTYEYIAELSKASTPKEQGEVSKDTGRTEPTNPEGIIADQQQPNPKGDEKGKQGEN